MTKLCYDLAPFVRNDSTVLILGSMPGVASLQFQQYYAHPQNRFWKILAMIYEKQQPSTYQDKLLLCETTHIALWDSIAICEREGSLDSAIVSEKPNDFSQFFYKYPKISKVCFNGRKAHSVFKKYWGELLKNDKISWHILPSTSAANASWSLDRLVNIWKISLID